MSDPKTNGANIEQSPTSLHTDSDPVNSCGAEAKDSSRIDGNNQVVDYDTLNMRISDINRGPFEIEETRIRSDRPIQAKGSSSSSAMFHKYLKRWGDFKDEKNKDKPLSMASLLCVGLLLLMFIAGFAGLVTIWFTDYYNSKLFDNLILAKGSRTAGWWEKPLVDTLLRVHIFNYTNTQRWMDRLDDKLVLEDIGPYVYRERLERVQVVYNPNHTISYKESRSYEFLPELSKGKQYDKVVFPNVLLMSATRKAEQLIPLFRYTVGSVLLLQETFKTITAEELIWGYEDYLYTAVRKYIDNARDKFGMLTTRKGISDDIITIHDGVDDIAKLAVIDRFDGASSLNMWSTDECNRIDGTDGSQFPPHYMDKKHTLQVFSKAFCRRFPLEFSEEVTVLDGITAWRYRPPMDVFAHPDYNEQNQCYCDKADECAPNGTFNVSKCFGDAPILLSFPHFFAGDSSLFDNLDGLNPNEELHRTYADIHPRMGFPIGGSSRIQINLQVPTDSSMIKNVSRFETKQILPIIWMEVSSGEITQELRATIYHSTFSANAIELVLRYGSLILCVLTCALIVAIVSWQKRKWRTSPNSTAAATVPNVYVEG